HHRLPYIYGLDAGRNDEFRLTAADAVERAARLEPFDLFGRVGMRDVERLRRAVGVAQRHLERRAGREAGKAGDVDLVVLADAVGRALALHFEKDGQRLEVLAAPRLERRELLQAVALEVDGDLHGLALREKARGDVTRLAEREARRGKLRRRGRLETHALAVR